jgi:folate-binding protein YgfZ
MSTLHYTSLPDRALIVVRGDDRGTFLQGLVSNDVRRVEAGDAAWAAFLTPQGKFLHEFFMFALGNGLWLDCERARRDDLVARLSRFKLRAKVEIESNDDLMVGAAWGRHVEAAFGLGAVPGRIKPLGTGVVYTEPRHPSAGVRWALLGDNAAAVLGELGLSPAAFADYDRMRIGLGLPDGSRDLEIEKALLLENGFEELNGVDFKKGCYVGQELTARTHFRALIKKRLLPVVIDGPTPPPGTSVMAAGHEAGEMRSSCGGEGLALIKLDDWRAGATLTAGAATLTPNVPSWMVLPGA